MWFPVAMLPPGRLTVIAERAAWTGVCAPLRGSVDASRARGRGKAGGRGRGKRLDALSAQLHIVGEGNRDQSVQRHPSPIRIRGCSRLQLGRQTKR